MCTYILCTYSDSASALAILRETIAREATQRRIHITDSYQVRYDYYTRLYDAMMTVVNSSAMRACEGHQNSTARSCSSTQLQQHAYTAVLYRVLSQRSLPSVSLYACGHYTLQPCQESVQHMLQLLHPKLQALHALSRQHALIDAVSEISSQEEGTTNTTNTNSSNSNSMPQWLTPEYAYVAANADKIKKVSFCTYITYHFLNLQKYKHELYALTA
jgi:hypothetical protein